MPADVLFVYNDVTAHTGYTCGLGVAALSSYIRRHGFVSSLAYYRHESDLPYVLETARRTDPCLVGFYGPSSGFAALQRLSTALRQAMPRLPQMYGGPDATLCPERLLTTPSLDAVCVGYGERPLVETLRLIQAGREFTGVQGLWAAPRNGARGTVVQNPPNADLYDLDEAIGFDHELFLRALARFRDFRRDEQSLEIILTRGCPRHCAFCSNAALRKVLGARIPRPSVDAAIRVVNECLEATELRHITFHDDDLALDRAWFRNFMERYRQEVRTPFWCNLRADGFDKEDLHLLKAAGATRVFVGIESGNAYVRNKLMQKGLSDEAIVHGFRLLHEAQLPAISQNIIGTPGETPRQFLDTVRMNARIAPHSAILSVFYPYPKTHLADVCSERGLLNGMMLRQEREEACLDTPEFPRAAIGSYRRRFDYLIRYEQLRRAHPLLLPVPLTPLTAAPLAGTLRLYRRLRSALLPGKRRKDVRQQEGPCKTS